MRILQLVSERPSGERDGVPDQGSRNCESSLEGVLGRVPLVWLGVPTIKNNIVIDVPLLGISHSSEMICMLLGLSWML